MAILKAFVHRVIEPATEIDFRVRPRYVNGPLRSEPANTATDLFETLPERA